VENEPKVEVDEVEETRIGLKVLDELRFEMARDLIIIPIRGDDGNMVDVVRYDQVLGLLKHREAILRGVFKPRNTKPKEV